MGNCLNPMRLLGKEVRDNDLEKGNDVIAERNEESVENKCEEAESALLVGTSAIQDEMVRRINQEFAELRQQLKKSQEIFMQNNGTTASAISINTVTQSCPILIESEVTKKPSLVCCSTQTDPTTTYVTDQQSGRRSSTSTQQDGQIRSLLDAIEDIDADGDGNYLDKLSDDIRLTINLPTVMEECEQDIETSPGSGPRRMSSTDKGSRRKLIRMPNAMEDESEHSNSNSNLKVDEEEAFKSDNDYRSAMSSVNTSQYNSLERPLQMGAYGSHRNGNGDSDSVSIVSDGNTTFGSPLSSPSSPTYWTPLEGSSSQETITNNDGDKTPVNEGNGLDKYEVQSCPGSSYYRTDYENGVSSLRKRGSSWGTTMPIHSKNDAISIGVIPESDREHMIKYAYDPVRRSSERNAGFLTGPEWRTLRIDLDKTNQDNYRKRFAQEEGNDIEGGPALDGGSQKSGNVPDLQEEAEEYLESFPNLVEQLFIHLDLLKKSHESPTELELKPISERFNHLALTFQTEHIALTNRKDTKLNEHDSSKRKIQEIINSITDNLQKLEDVAKRETVPEEVTEISRMLKYLPGDLDLYTNNLSKTSRRVGMMDVQVRLYKMIEVMVLYVHILRNLCAEKEKDFQNAKKLLDKNNIQFSRGKSTIMTNNNNNNDRVSWDDSSYSQFKENESQRDEDRRPRQILQHLLGPKKSSVGLDCKMQESLISTDSELRHNAIMRNLSDAYETLRCELVWPWNWEETWKGTKHSFSVILMIVGFLIICRSLLPIVSADDPPPVTDLASIFSKHGNLDHVKIPPL